MDTNILRSTPEKVVSREETPHACMGGWVYMGFVDDELEGEQIERVPCCRCRPEIH